MRCFSHSFQIAVGAPAVTAVTQLHDYTLSTPGFCFVLFGVISFLCKESQLLEDTGHSALSVSLHSVAGLQEGKVLCSQASSFPPLKAAHCLVCRGQCLPAPFYSRGWKGSRAVVDFFKGQYFLYHCPFPIERGQAGLCLMSLDAFQERHREVVLTL